MDILRSGYFGEKEVTDQFDALHSNGKEEHTYHGYSYLVSLFSSGVTLYIMLWKWLKMLRREWVNNLAWKIVIFRGFKNKETLGPLTETVQGIDLDGKTTK